MNGDISFTVIEVVFMGVAMLGLGILMLVRGGNWTIDAAIHVARHFGISPLVVGFTIVAFGTSLPELVVSVNANLHGLPGIAMGNVLGSNIANILVVLGITGVFATVSASPKVLARDIGVMLLATFLLAGLMIYGEIATATGMLMVFALAVYTFMKYRAALNGTEQPDEQDEPVFKSVASSLVYLFSGLILISFGAEFLVRGAKVTAGVMGMPEDVIGLTVIAVGTSLPELTTCLAAARKNQSEMVLGNIIGSNFFNILMIIGTTAAVRPIHISAIAPQMTEMDIWVTLGVSVLFSLIIMLYRKINRVVGIMFLGGYCAYMLALYLLYIA